MTTFEQIETETNVTSETRPECEYCGRRIAKPGFCGKSCERDEALDEGRITYEEWCEQIPTSEYAAHLDSFYGEPRETE